MNVQEYIASGILEAYALGELTESERAGVAEVIREYPEVRDEFRRVEGTLEQVVLATAIAPPASAKGKLMARISTQPKARVVSMVPDRTWKYAAAASIALALITSYLAFYYRQQWKETSESLVQIVAQNQQMAQDYNLVNQKLDKIQNDFSIIENTAFTKVVMRGTANDKQALASVYYNASSKEVFLSIQQLRLISRENQFQLWAIVKGVPVDAGVFDLNFAGLLKMKSIDGAAAFAVTIESRGGKDSPTLETMQVVGSVVAGPS